MTSIPRLPLVLGLMISLGAVVATAGKALATDGKIAAPPSEEKYQQANPKLYEAARKYFPGDDADVSARRIFRLTQPQLDASVAALFPKLKIVSVKETMPRDPLQTNYEYAENLALNPSNLAPLGGWIKGIVEQVKKAPENAVDCKTANNSPDCLATEARRFVTAAFRADVSPAKMQKIVEFYSIGVKEGGFAQATADLTEIVLNSPDFLFRKELETDRRGRVSPRQALQALTYTLADAPPEKFGLDSGDALRHVQTPEAVRETVDAIVKSKDAREKLVRFFKAWLEVTEPQELRVSKEVFPVFTQELAKEMTAETDRFLRAELSKPAPKLRDITQSKQAFSSKLMQSTYADDGKDGAKRFGIFSQPAVIASHSGPASTQPIKRGVFWVRKVMCMELEPPPQGLDISLYESTEKTTERQRIAETTVQKACIGCHKFIDPFGFAFENYDALGRWRTKDNDLPIDSSILIEFLDEGKSKADGPVEALKTFTNSAMFKQCFVRQVFRYYMGRQEEPSDDPVLRTMFLDFTKTDDQDISTLVQSLATSDRILRRQ
jgi:Protein of unknown function (DUF1588)/Protein of unknown function (DUF1592)/Protein of unknown function (DUF1595)/Protein of unknown function (DUF1585)